MKFKFIVFVVLVLIGCREQKTDSQIDFEQADTTVQGVVNTHNQSTLKVAVAAMMSPKETYHYYEDLFKYISKKANKEIIFVQKMTYGEINKLIKDHKLDIAFICSGAYVADTLPVSLLAVPFGKNGPYYNSYIIVNKKTGITKFEQLEGKRFAFTDSLSNTGRLYPLKRVAELNQIPDSFFSDIIFSNAHDYSIKLVAEHLVDAAAVDGLIYDFFQNNNPEILTNINIIEISENYGIPPIVVSNQMNNSLRTELQNLFFNIHLDSMAKPILDHLLIQKFVPVGDTLYNSIQKMRLECK